MSANVSELFDRIFAESDLANHYLASLMSWSEDRKTVEIKRKQVQLLRDYFINRNGDSSGKYLSLLEDIERILTRDSEGACHMINSIIPSATIRKYMQQTGFSFTDSELATIIYHTKLPLPVKHRYWQQLMEKTEDTVLHQQIDERIAYDQKCYQLFSENDGGYFYETVIGETTREWEQDDVIGHFASLELAIECAKRLGLSFSVRKYQIVGLCKKIIVPYGLFNPRLFPDSLSDTRPYQGESIAEFRYTAEGVLQNFWTYEISIEETVAVEDWGKSRFEWKFIRMPNPFEEGDCVRVVGTNQEGMVVTSQVEWNAFLHRVAEQHPIVDYSDASIVVDYSNGKDPYDHNHVQPIYLERLDNAKETDVRL